jgi:hypothetical protein
LQSKFTPIHLWGFVCGVGTVESVVHPAELGSEGGDARHRRIDAATCSRCRWKPTSASGRTPSTRWCRGRDERQQAVAVGNDHRLEGGGCIAKVVVWHHTDAVGPDPGDAQAFSIPGCACAVACATSRRVAVSVHRLGGAPAGGEDRHEHRLARRTLDHPAAVLAVERNRSGRSSSSIIQSSISVRVRCTQGR